MFENMSFRLREALSMNLELFKVQVHLFEKSAPKGKNPHQKAPNFMSAASPECVVGGNAPD
jgi:hypothetical protein